jgi:hypothetical protein
MCMMESKLTAIRGADGVCMYGTVGNKRTEVDVHSFIGVMMW